MAQTTTGFPKSIFQLEVSTNGSSWTDISGQGTQVNVSGGDQMIGEQHTADGNAPIVVGSNKTGAVQLQCNIVYTETAGQAFQTVWARYEGAAKSIYVRYAPKGSTAGNERYTACDDAGSAALCPIGNCLPPSMDAGSGDVTVASFTVTAPKLVQAVIS